VIQVRPPDLIERVGRGQIRIPRFQRPFRWEPRDVEQLFDSILRGYPIGNLLMWERPAPAEDIEIAGVRLHAAAQDAAWLVVDGQQRLTGLVGALTADEATTDPRFRIFYDLVEGGFTSLPRSRQPREHQLPVSVAVDNRELLRWQRERPWLSQAQFDQCDTVSASIRQYEIPVYVVQGDDEEALKDIFDRMNTFGKRLTRSEVFNALHSVSKEHSPSDLDSLAAGAVALGFGAIPQPLLVQSVMASREGKTDRDFRKEFKDEADRYQAFADTQVALAEAIAFLREQAGIPHARLLPYALFLPVLVRFTKLFGQPQARAAELLRRWVWRGSTVAVAPQGNTVALRNFAAAVYGDPIDSAVRLLGLLPRPKPDWRWVPDLSQTALNRAQGKLNVLALLDLHPVLLEPMKDAEGEEIAPAGARVQAASVLGALLDTGTPILEPIVSDRQADIASPHMRALPNRIVHPPLSAGRAEPALLAAHLPPSTLDSHALPANIVDRLAAGRGDQSLADRAHILKTVLADRVQRRALWGFESIRGPISLSSFDDHDEAASDTGA
jgi:hypothetical protein